MSTPRPGWYPDPSPEAAPGTFRWWDGSSWTAELSDSATARPPADPQPVAAGAVAAKSSSRLVAMLLGLSLIVSGGVVGFIGWSSWQDQRRLEQGGGQPGGASASVGPKSAKTDSRSDRRTGPGSPTAGPHGRLDEVTREAVISDARMVLPGHPYELVSDPITIPGVFDAMFFAGAPVHTDYNGTDDWIATVGIAHIPADAWQPENPKAFAKRVMDGVTARFFGGYPTTSKNLRHGATMVDGQPCAEISADVHYKIKKVPSRYDRVRLIGCPNDDGSVITAVSAVPEDADRQVSRLAAESLETFSLR